MNQDLQDLEIKVENEGTTPQGRLTATEWNILVAAVKSLDLTGGSVDITSILQAVADAGYATQEWVNNQDYATTMDFNKFVKDFVTRDTTQPISGIKDFTNGLKVGGLSVYKSQADTIYLNANLVVRGGITAFGTNETITASIFEALPIDGATLKRTENGVLYVDTTVVGGGGGTGGGISIADVENYLTTNGYATQSWVTGKGYITGINASMVTNALGYTPYNSSNPAGYITSSGSITGNAATATKLATTRSIWGQSFDGSTDVSGNIFPINTSGCYYNENGISYHTNKQYQASILRVTSSYNVAIGGTTASEKLHVHGRVLAAEVVNTTTWVSDTAQLIANCSGTGYHVGIAATSGGYAVLQGGHRGVGAIPLLLNPSGGNVAIGGTTASGKLHVYGNVISTGAFDSYSGNSHYLVKGKEVVGSYEKTYFLCDSAPADGMMTWLAGRTVVLATGSTKTRAVTIDASQNVGIGLSAPTQKLHVNGKGIFADATNPWISLQRDGVNWYLQVVSTGLKLGRTSALGVLIDDSGNMVAPGGVTATNSSDKRLKRNIRKFNASKVLMSLGGVYEYEYIDSEVQKNHIYEGTHYGLIYQHVKGTALDVMCHEREDGFGTLNYIHPKFISLIAGATMENISEVEKLKRNIRHLEQKVKQLEQRA